MLEWDTYFMSLVYLTSMKSKDKSTNLGAVIVGPDNEIRATGYNSFVRGLDDNKKERQERPHKYYFFEHAERNAIYNAVRIGTPLKDCIIYTQGIPCSDCGRAIIQSGIREIVYHGLWEQDKIDKWDEHARYTMEICEETGTILREFNGDIIDTLFGYKRGNTFELK